MSDIGDRFRSYYEDRYRFYLLRRSPVIVRVDGRAFHTLTKDLRKPFDSDFVSAMSYAACALASEMQGFKLAFVQSDEASFLLSDFDFLDSSAWFDYCKSKVETISASIMSVYFNKRMGGDFCGVFDARAFNVPSSDVTNYFLYRALDWNRNSISMFCGAHFSHEELVGKSTTERHDMLRSIGLNWAVDVSDQLKNGTWILEDGTLRYDVLPNYSSVNSVVPL